MDALRSSYRTDKVLFACHLGRNGALPVGALVSNHCLPIAFERDEDSEPAGFHSVWRRELDAFDFFCLAFDDAHAPSNGLWVYEVSWDSKDADRENGTHLNGGAFRRPTVEELTSIARGECPWADGVLP